MHLMYQVMWNVFEAVIWAQYWLNILIGSKVGLDEPISCRHPKPSKPVCYKTWSPWIPFPTIQNHAFDVSSDVECF
jgi:hypothetical protein